jgi:diguanylate cyclase (GGDEF)-like protein/PAS domain S-box-containing protein
MCGRLVLWGYRRIGGILPMKKLGGLIKNNEDWLLRRIIEFARDRGYIEKFWVLREAWRIIVRELSESLVIFLDGTGESDDKLFASVSGKVRLYQMGGVGLSEFIGLLKCCRRAYQELICTNLTSDSGRLESITTSDEYFDRLEIKIITEFTKISSDSLVHEMQVQNKKLTNEKIQLLIILESLLNPIMYFNRDNKLRWANQTARELIRDTEGITLTHYILDEPIGPPEWLLPEIIEFRSTDYDNVKSSMILDTKDGGHHVELNLSRMVDADGEFIGTIVILNDFTDYQQTKNELRLTCSQLHQLFCSVPDGLIFISSDFVILHVNEKFAHWFGFNSHDLIGQKCFNLLKLSSCGSEDCSLKQAAGKTSAFEREREIVGENGVTYHVLVATVPMYDTDGAFMGIMQNIKDITDRVQTEKEIRYHVLHDKLTGLYNRACLDKKLGDVRPDEFPYSIIMGDLNGLKIVNDAFGYRTGDRLLIEIAKILRESCRPNDTVIRSGGDEFVILLPGADETVALSIVKRIKKKCKESTFQPFQPSISLGFAVKTSPEQDILSVFQKAETKMYQHKMLEVDSSPGFSIQSLQQMLHERSNETEEHTERLRILVRLIGQELGLSETLLFDLDLLAALHDIGKIAIPDEILNKPGKLTDEEWGIMKRHSEIGYRIARTSPVLVPIAEYILAHHEHWNGQGYPRGLVGGQIPLPARILAVADAYDAMVSIRLYKDTFTPEQAVDELKNCSGTQFDPMVVSAFISLFQKRQKARKKGNETKYL